MIIRKIERSAARAKARVAAYARVSTEAEKQMESLNTQMDAYISLISQNPLWEFARVYSDPGVSGTGAERRPGFLRMLADAKAGEIDIILVKSISRFARNAADAQRYVRELKSYAVEVCFEREAISSFDSSSDMVFCVLAAVAQEESRSISENVKWSYRKRAELGERKLGNNRVLGYDVDKHGRLAPNGDAWIVKRAFDLFVECVPLERITCVLAAEGARALRGESALTSKAVRRMLRNEIYVGDRRLQKQPPKNYLTKRPDPNAAYDSYYITDAHEPIISRDTWIRAQTLINQTRRDYAAGVHRNSQNTHELYGRLFCAHCGAPYTRRTRQNRDGSQHKTWICRERLKGSKGNGCKNPIIKEQQLLQLITAKTNNNPSRIIITNQGVEVN